MTWQMRSVLQNTLAGDASFIVMSWRHNPARRSSSTGRVRGNWLLAFLPSRRLVTRRATASFCSRMFAYGLLSVVLVLYLVEVGLNEWEAGLLLTLTLAGDTAISLWLTTTADRLGRRRTLMVGAVLMVLAGIAFISTGSFVLLV